MKDVSTVVEQTLLFMLLDNWQFEGSLQVIPFAFSPNVFVLIAAVPVVVPPDKVP